MTLENLTIWSSRASESDTLGKGKIACREDGEEEALAVVEAIEDRYRQGDGNMDEEPITEAIALKKRLTSKEEPSSDNMRDFREFVRSRRAALAGFLEQGARLKAQANVLVVTPAMMSILAICGIML